MADQLDFDPAMFGLKANHGMLKSEGSGSNNVQQGQGGGGGGGAASSQYRGGGQQRGGRGRGRGTGSNNTPRGGRGGGGRGGFTAGQRGSSDGQPFKRQRFDNQNGHGGSHRGPPSFFKPSMLENPWAHLS